MPGFRPVFLRESESKIVASRQMLSFITLPGMEEEAPPHVRPPSGESLFSLYALPAAAITGGDAILNWVSRDIYDVDGLLLFRDQTIDLGGGFEWRVRTAASDLLRTPVWSVEAGPSLNVEALVADALARLHDTSDLEPVTCDDEPGVRLVAYSYPKLGILCRRRNEPAAKFVIKLRDLTIIPVDPAEPSQNPESLNAVWSPYDVAGRYTSAHYRRLWERNMRLLPALPATPKELPDSIRAAWDNVEQKVVTPRLQLEGQATPSFCAAATARMILLQHGIDESQNLLASEMHIGDDGVSAEEQVNAINRLVGKEVRAEEDLSTSFVEAQDEILHDRPFKTSSSRHARAVGGFRVEAQVKEGLYIYDPEPSNQGKIYFEDWIATLHHDYMYVRSVSPPA